MCGGYVSGRRDGRTTEISVTGDMLEKKDFGLLVKWAFDVNPLRMRRMCVV